MYNILDKSANTSICEPYHKFGFSATNHMAGFKNRSKKINRRHFLLNSALALTGYLTGFTKMPSAIAGQRSSPLPNQPPRIALIIDDIGYNRSIARQFAQLDLPLTFSVLPRLHYSRELAYELHTRGFEIMLHQPMEPYSACCDPGPGALFVGDNKEKIERILDENIGSMPFANGMNNHMGSRFTESPGEIEKTLMFIKTRGLFFIDSITSSNSIAYAIARKYRLSTAHRHVFLDNSRSVPAILLQLNHLKQRALKSGCAIGIGHPYGETLHAINRFKRSLNRRDITLVSASQIISKI
jgi:polysaccharide deacetylase 2 family uncharacterized protein YibQ